MRAAFAGWLSLPPPLLLFLLSFIPNPHLVQFLGFSVAFALVIPFPIMFIFLLICHG